MPISQQVYRVLDIVQQFAPRPYRTTSNSRSKFVMRCPVHHPTNRSYDNHFTVSEDQQLWKCHVCGAHGNAYQLYRLLSGQGSYTPQIPVPIHESHHEAPPQGCTLSELAQAKHLDAAWLHDVLGWTDSHWFNIPAILIPYFYSNLSQAPERRFRVGLTGDRFRWAPGSHQQLYGLQFLEQIKQRNNYCLIVEGETNFASLHYYGFNVIGVPGANNYRPEWNHYFAGIPRIILCKDPDAGGNQLEAKLKQHFPGLLVTQTTPLAKAPNDLATLLGEEFHDHMLNLILDVQLSILPQEDIALFAIPDLAEPDWLEPDQDPQDNLESQGFECDHGVSTGSYPIYWNNQVEDIRRYSWWDETRKFLDGQKDYGVAYFRSVSKWKKAADMEACYFKYRVWRCKNTGEKFVKRFKCGEPSCAFCSMWQTMEFFYKAERNPDGTLKQTKVELLQEHLVNPVIWLITCEEHDFENSKEQVKALQAEIVNADAKFTERHKTVNIARDHIRGMKVRARENKVRFKFALLGEYFPEDRELIQGFFEGQLGHVTVEQVACQNIRDAIEQMSRFMAVRIEVDSPEAYGACREGLLRSRFFQGKGLYEQISGNPGARKRSLNPKPPRECPVCGSCEPIEQLDRLPVEGTQTEFVVSEWTGQKYQRLL